MTETPRRPTLKQEDVFRECVRNAAKRVKLTAKVAARWRTLRVRDGAARACGVLGPLPDGSCVIHLHVDAMPEDLRRDCYHQLQHVADIVSSRQLSQHQLEARANAFAEEMLARHHEAEDGERSGGLSGHAGARLCGGVWLP